MAHASKIALVEMLERVHQLIETLKDHRLLRDTTPKHPEMHIELGYAEFNAMLDAFYEGRWAHDAVQPGEWDDRRALILFGRVALVGPHPPTPEYRRY